MTDQNPAQANVVDTASLESPVHPPSLVLAAYLHGGPKAPVVASRVLVLGAGKGEEVLALAFHDREGSYLGVGDDAEDIASARAAAASIGLTNVRFERVDWHEPPLELGEFDVVVARGVLARAPESARSEVLRLCRSCLSDGGILYLDYPVIPGAANRKLAWSLIGPRVEAAAEPGARVAQARAAAEMYRGMLGPSAHPYPQLLALELERVVQSPDGVVWRDYIAAPEAAFLHREVVMLADAHGLRFVCDAAFNEVEGFVPAEIREELLGRGVTGVDQEQALDVLRNRAHRGTVFCKAEVRDAGAPGPELLDELGIASELTPVSESVRLEAGAEEAFVGVTGERIGSVDPLLKAVLLELREGWPRPARFAALVSAGVLRLQREGMADEPSDEHVAGVARDLWALYMRGLVRLFPNAPRFGAAAGKGLHALGRLEAKASAGAGRVVLTTPLHTRLALSGFDAALVREMVPGADEDGLVEAMLVHAATGSVAIEVGGARLSDPDLVEPMVRALVRRTVKMLGRWGLLE